jgi:Protein of Unknown function (DUF2784)
MTYRLAADALVLFHLCFILFVVFGGLLVIKWPALKWLHLPAALWGALVELDGLECPLTRWENLLRGRAGGAGYGGGFVDHYIVRAMYPAGLTRGIEYALAAAVVIINVSIYVYIRNTTASGLHDRKAV